MQHLDLTAYSQLNRIALDSSSLLAVLPHGHPHHIPSLPDLDAATLQLGRAPHFTPEGATFFPLPKNPILPLHPMWELFHRSGYCRISTPYQSWHSLHAVFTERAQLAMDTLAVLDQTLHTYGCVCLQPDTSTLRPISGRYLAYWLHTPSQSLVSIKLDLLYFDVPMSAAIRQPNGRAPDGEAAKPLPCKLFLGEELPPFCSQLRNLELLSFSC